jgi:hypothetical protein
MSESPWSSCSINVGEVRKTIQSAIQLSKSVLEDSHFCSWNKRLCILVSENQATIMVKPHLQWQSYLLQQPAGLVSLA